MDRPSPELVIRTERIFNDRDDDYDAAVSLVFQQWRRNTNDAEILVKVVVLNRLYGANIRRVRPVVERIKELNIDARVDKGDPSVVDDLANIKFPDLVRHCLSFASKYCAWHNSTDFPIYDSYVESSLRKYEREFHFGNFRREEMNEYRRYREILDAFQRFFGLSAYSRRQIDKFLWIEEAESRGELGETGNGKAPMAQNDLW